MVVVIIAEKLKIFFICSRFLGHMRRHRSHLPGILQNWGQLCSQRMPRSFDLPLLPSVGRMRQIYSYRALCVLERTLPTELLRQLSWLGRITHTEQGRVLCVLERTLPTELLRQLSWLGRITHTEQARALCVLERTLPTELPRQLSWLGRITHTEQGRALCVLERTLPTELLRQFVSNSLTTESRKTKPITPAAISTITRTITTNTYCR